MQFALDAHFPSPLFHAHPQLVNQFRNALGPFLLLGILEALAATNGGISVTGIRESWNGSTLVVVVVVGCHEG